MVDIAAMKTSVVHAAGGDNYPLERCCGPLTNDASPSSVQWRLSDQGKVHIIYVYFFSSSPHPRECVCVCACCDRISCNPSWPSTLLSIPTSVTQVLGFRRVPSCLAQFSTYETAKP